MPYCQECGYELKQGAKFCSGCGYNVGETEDDTQRQQEWAGKIIKCPSCGEDIPSFTTNCPSCGHEFREIKANMTVKELAYKLEQIEKTRTVNNNAKRGEISKADEQKISLISTFPIPNTKDDLFEFLILAESNINSKAYGFGNMIFTTSSQRQVSHAWFIKMEQIYEKAKLSFGQSFDFNKFKEIYENKRREIKQRKNKRKRFWVGVVVIYILILTISIVALFALSDTNSNKIEAENERLETIVEEVYDAIEDENYVLARAKAANLVFSDSVSYEGKQASEKWDKTREELLVIIEQAEKDSNKQELTDND